MMEELLLNIMETDTGRKFVWEILEGTGVDTGAFNHEPCKNAWLAGRASLGIEILNLLRNSDRGAELEFIMRREARHPPDSKKQKDFIQKFKEGEE